MKKLLKAIPLPITGLILSMFALGNLVQTYSESLRLAIGLVAFVLYILAALKVLSDFSSFKKEMENPITASVFPTYSMAGMLLATYLKPFIGSGAKIIWQLMVLIHIGLIIYFIVKFVLNFSIKKVFASWYIPFVGLVIASVTSPAFEMQGIGQIIFWFGLATYVVLLPTVLYRIHNVGEMPEPSLPLIAINTAPCSLLLAGYNAAFKEKNMLLFWIMVVLAQILLVYVLVNIPKMMKKGFFPSYSALTFPFVITGIGIKTSIAFLNKSGIGAPAFFGPLVKIEEIIALFFVAFVFVSYLIFISKALKKSN